MPQTEGTVEFRISAMLTSLTHKLARALYFLVVIARGWTMVRAQSA
jgi:hypothetical protein